MIERFKFKRVNEITGTFVLIVLAVLIVGVVWTGHSQRWFKSNVTLQIVLPENGAAGIRQGSEVYFLGTRVGSVSDVIVDAKGRMEAETSIRRDFFRFIRADSSAVVKKKFGVAGDSFFEITRGEGQPLPEANASIVCNEQFQSALEAAVEEIRREALQVLKKTSTGLDTWTQLGADLGKTRLHLDELTAKLDGLASGVEQGKGTVGRLLTDATLVQNAERFVGRLDGLAAGLETGQGTAGKLLTDKAMGEAAQELVLRANATLRQLQLVVTNLDAAVKNIETGSARFPEITEAVANEAKDLPGLVLQTRTSMREMERLIEALQKHWLVRKHVNPTNPPPTRPLPVEEGTPKKPVKNSRSSRNPAP